MPSPSSLGNGSVEAGALEASRFKEGDIVKGTVKAVNDFGVFVEVGAGTKGLLPWHQVSGNSPVADEVLELVVAYVDDEGRLTLAAPDGRGRSPVAAGKGRAGATKPAVGGFIYDVVLGVRPRRKGGKGDKGDRRGAYTYPDGLPISELLPEDDVSGHVTNIEREGCWIDIGATKDAYLSWTEAPSRSSRWLVGDLIEDLKIKKVNNLDIVLKWDNEGISSLTDTQWEKLFTAGPCHPQPKEEDQGPATGENCCALLGAPGSTAEDRSADEEQQTLLAPPGSAAATPQSTGAPLSAEDFPNGVGQESRGCGKVGGKGYTGGWWKGMGGARGSAAEAAPTGEGGWKGSVLDGPGPGRGKGRTWRGPSPTTGKSAGWGPSTGSTGGGTKGWGKGEGPAYANADDYGSCAKPAEARARSAPPPSRPPLRPIGDVSIGEVVRGRVMGLSRLGALVDFGCEAEGFIPQAMVPQECRKGQVVPRLSIIGVDTASRRVTLEPLEDE